LKKNQPKDQGQNKKQEKIKGLVWEITG
jgi:hypothetical protein